MNWSHIGSGSSWQQHLLRFGIFASILFAVASQTFLGFRANAQPIRRDIEDCNSRAEATAILGCTRFLNAKPATIELRIRGLKRRAWAYSKQHEHEKAIIDLTEAITLQGDRADLLYERGVAYWHSLDFDKSIADHTKVVALMPQSAFGYHGLCQTLHSMGKKELAIANCDKAVATNLTDKLEITIRKIAEIDLLLLANEIAGKWLQEGAGIRLVCERLRTLPITSPSLKEKIMEPSAGLCPAN